MRIGGMMVGMAALAAFPACSQVGNVLGFPSPERTERSNPRASRSSLERTEVCVVDTSVPAGLRSVRALKDRRTGETFVVRMGRRRPLARAYPAVKARGYARGEAWFRESQAIRVGNREYRKYGTERVVPADKLKRGSAFAGIPLFVDPRDASPPQVLYVPSRPGCVFQPYLREGQARRR